MWWNLHKLFKCCTGNVHYLHFIQCKRLNLSIVRCRVRVHLQRAKANTRAEFYLIVAATQCQVYLVPWHAKETIKTSFCIWSRLDPRRRTDTCRKWFQKSVRYCQRIWRHVFTPFCGPKYLNQNKYRVFPF